MSSRLHSIIINDLSHCIISGSPNVAIHHCLGAANRNYSDSDGLVVPLEPTLHNEGKRPNDKDLLGVRCDVHHCKNMAALMHMIAQLAYERDYILKSVELPFDDLAEEARRSFVTRYGKNYL